MTNARDKANIPVLNFQSKGIDDNADATAITIDSSENVGIGTTSPDTLLSLEKNNAPRIQYKDTSGGTDAKVWRTMGLDSDYRLETRSDNLSNGQLAYVATRSGYVVNEHKFFTSDSERMRIDSSGRVIIGGTTPDTSAKLTLEGGDLRFNTDDKGILWGNNEINGNNASDFINIVTAGAERMRITSSGSVLVGTTNILSASNTTDSGCMLTSSHGWITNNGASALRLQRLTSTGLIQTFYYSGTLVGDISVTGSSTSYNTSSDYRLKENVSYDFDATSRLKQLKPARFNFIADADTTVDGFIAHEVSSVVPEAISGEKDAVDEDGNPEYQGIDQAKLVPLLVKTIQELEARITALETNQP